MPDANGRIRPVSVPALPWAKFERLGGRPYCIECGTPEAGLCRKLDDPRCPFGCISDPGRVGRHCS